MNQAVITADNKTALVEIVTWIALTIAVLSVIARLITKLITIRRINLDDYLIITSLVRDFCCALSKLNPLAAASHRSVSGRSGANREWIWSTFKQVEQ